MTAPAPLPSWQPSGRFEWLRLRGRIQAEIRNFFEARGVTEVTTPLLTACGVSDPQIQSLELGVDQGFLRTSPEYYHKRLLAAGFGDLYEMGPVMRAAEHGRRHRLEFTLLEWYRLGLDWEQLAAEALDLIQTCSRRVGRSWKTQMLSWQTAFTQTLDFDPLKLGADASTDETLLTLTENLPADCDQKMRLDYLMVSRIQASLPPDQLTVIYHYPADQAALAELEPEDPRLARRFEVFAGSLELANAYQELRDPLEQARRFDEDNRRRQGLGLPTMPTDEALLAALAHGLPACSGIALGVDRLMMALTGTEDISEVIAFS